MDGEDGPHHGRHQEVADRAEKDEIRGETAERITMEGEETIAGQGPGIMGLRAGEDSNRGEEDEVVHRQAT